MTTSTRNRQLWWVIWAVAFVTGLARWWRRRQLRSQYPQLYAMLYPTKGGPYDLGGTHEA